MTKRILFAGGGTAGPVTPLLAAAAAMRVADSTVRVAWAGTATGPERDLVSAEGYPYFTVPVVKLPRYISFKWLTLPIDGFRARLVARKILRVARPDLVVSAGGFTAVPIVRAARAKGIPCFAHQLDFVPGLSNRLIARACRVMTSSFAYTEPPFGRGVTVRRIPTPTRFGADDLPSREDACARFGLDPAKRVLLVTGGGTGAMAINIAITHTASMILKDAQILHLTGKGKSPDIETDDPAYIRREFLVSDMEMASAYAAADLVVSRAGLGTIAELAACRKAAILVPLPRSPQEANAKALGAAVRVIPQTVNDWGSVLAAEIHQLLEHETSRHVLGAALADAFPTDRGEALAKAALRLLI